MSELAPPPADAPLILVADDVPANVELLFDQLHVLGFQGGEPEHVVGHSGESCTFGFDNVKIVLSL